MSPPPLYDLVDVSFAIGDVTILDHVDLVIAGEGITVVLGPSGAGKSMLLRLLNRLEVATGGEVLFRGEPVATLDPLTLRRRVGMVFQRPAPFPGTVRDNMLVADPACPEDALVAALDDAGLDRTFLDRSADDLSGGEAQRMCLARTLVTRPEALLMDEPTSALDPEARHRLERTARRLADGGRPLVWVTHDLDQARRLADDVVVLVAGRIADDAARAHFLADDQTDEARPVLAEPDRRDIGQGHEPVGDGGPGDETRGDDDPDGRREGTRG